MNRKRKTLPFLLIVVVVLQFIQPVRNISTTASSNDISTVYEIPENVHQVFSRKCYDCHSNNTRYPWYFNIQPVGWWLAAHIHDGKEHVNFSEFSTYDAEKKNDLLEEILEVVEERSMPLKVYVLLNSHSEITEADEKAIQQWISVVSKNN